MAKKKYVRYDPEKNKKLLLEALERNLGLVTPSCKEIGISRNQFYVYYRSDDSFKEAVDDIQEILTDFVENELFNKIKSGDTASILFFMKHRGRKRGYAESMDISGNVNSAVTIIKLNGPDGDSNEPHERLQ